MNSIEHAAQQGEVSWSDDEAGIQAGATGAAGDRAMAHMLQTLGNRAAHQHAGPGRAAETRDPPGRSRARRVEAMDNPRDVICRMLSDAGMDDDAAARSAALICQQFKGQSVYFSAREALGTVERDQHIRTARAEGRSYGSIARQYHLSRTQVRRICGAP